MTEKLKKLKKKYDQLSEKHQKSEKEYQKAKNEYKKALKEELGPELELLGLRLEDDMEALEKIIDRRIEQLKSPNTVIIYPTYPYYPQPYYPPIPITVTNTTLGASLVHKS